MSVFKSKNVVITGAVGTVGKALVNNVFARGAERIIGIDINENELFSAELKNPNVEYYNLDIRNDSETLNSIFRRADIVVHTAACKHVGLSEKSPFQAISTNVTGLQNLTSIAKRNDVEHFLFTSSDKAVNPTNLMGATKLVGEKIVTAAQDQFGGTKFISSRFGNVLGSNGSVVEIFKNQVALGQSLTLTHPDMSRFVMTLQEASSLVLDALEYGIGGETFVPKMPVMMIKDLAEVFYEYYSLKNDIIYIGTKPGEKMFEELNSSEEVRRTIESEHQLIIHPALTQSEKYFKHHGGKLAGRIFSSQSQAAMSKAEILNLLIENELIGKL